MTNIELLDELPLEVALNVSQYLYGGSRQDRAQDVVRMTALLRAYKPPYDRGSDDVEKINALEWPRHLTFEVNGVSYVCECAQRGDLAAKLVWVPQRAQDDCRVRAKCQLDRLAGGVTVVIEVDSRLMGCVMEAQVEQGVGPVEALERVYQEMAAVYAEVSAVQDGYQPVSCPSSELCMELNPDAELTAADKEALPTKVKLKWRGAAQCWGWSRSEATSDWLSVGSLERSWRMHTQKSLLC